jgi:hypothetical protein
MLIMRKKETTTPSAVLLLPINVDLDFLVFLEQKASGNI